MGRHIGFVGTRFFGVDGVSLEASKWAEVLEREGHTCFWFAGQSNRLPAYSLEVPGAHFQDLENRWINARLFGQLGRDPQTTELIHRYRSYLKTRLVEFIDRFDLSLLIAENALTIPLHIPLGLALVEIIAEKQIPTIAHHHDFHWERTRFAVNGASDYLRTAFPPDLPGLAHVVINSEAQQQLALRTGMNATLIPNVLDFAHPPQIDPQRARAFREAIGLHPRDRMILQPTRIVSRKGIEHAVDLVARLALPRTKLVVTHPAGDEGFEYADWLQIYARERKVDLRLVDVPLADPWVDGCAPDDRHTLWDIYPLADLVTFPSAVEGFGNALLEAVYFKKPVLINRYPTFVKDIEPLGFDLVVMDGYLSEAAVAAVDTVLRSPVRRQKMVETNFALARRHFSYEVLTDSLRVVLAQLQHPTRTASRPPCPAAPNVYYLPRQTDDPLHLAAARSAPS